MTRLLLSSVAVFVFVVALGLPACSAVDASPQPSAKSSEKKGAVKEVKLILPLKKKSAVVIRETVNLDPVERGAVSADVDSTVLKWHVEQNQYVKAGQLVATMDSTNFELQLEQARAGLSGLEIQYAGLGGDYRRVKALQEQGAASQQQLAALETQYQALEKQIDSNRKSISLMERMLGKTKVRAPFAGVITQKRLAVGGKTVTMMPDSAQLALIERIDKLKAVVWLSEIYYGEIQTGDPVSFEIPSLQKTVTSTIASKGLSINDARKFSLVSYLENRDLTIPAGVSAVAVLSTKERERIIVPPTAVTQQGARNAELFSVVRGVVTAHQVVVGFAFEEGLEVAGAIPDEVVGDASLVKAGEAVLAKK